MTELGMTSLNSRYDVVVVGAGHNGLVSAAYLAKAGLSVLMLEREDVTGGATQSKQVEGDLGDASADS